MRITLIILLLILLLNSLHGQDKKLLPPEKISKLVPEKIKGFTSGDSQSKIIKIGNIQYSILERNFTSGKKAIMILLFDYVEAPVMYQQLTREWRKFKPIASDSLQVHALTIDDSFGWETILEGQNRTQILLGIKRRYYMCIEARHVDISTLRFMVSDFKLDSYPD